jgi:GMP synthase-like glutamine amidotransferase
MKVATCLQHVPFEGPGVFRQALEARGYALRIILVPSEGLPPDPGDFLLIMGGPMSVNDPDSWIGEELHVVKAAMEKGIPVLGICFGSQLLAKALGGSVVHGPTFEVGMVPVRLTDEGKTDSVFSQLPSTFQVFQWHGEGITLPPQTKSLLASPDFPVQAFRAQERCYGLLFHPEMEEEGIQALCQECSEDVKKGKVPPEVIQAQATPYLPMLHQFADRLIGHLAQ